jgi:hypothetical protein
MGFSCPHCAQDIGEAIPKERFDEVNEKRKTAETAATQAAAALEEARKGAVDIDAVRAELDLAREELTAATTGHEAYKQITSAGIAAEVVDGFLDSYGKLGDGRPATIGEWVTGMRSGAIEPPALLAPHVKAAAPAAQVPPAAPAAPPAAPAVVPPATPPAANAGTQPHPHAPDPYDAAAITRMTPTEYAAYKVQRDGPTS